MWKKRHGKRNAHEKTVESKQYWALVALRWDEREIRKGKREKNGCYKCEKLTRKENVIKAKYKFFCLPCCFVVISRLWIFLLHCSMCSLLFTFCSVYATFNNEILQRVDGIYKLNFAFIFFLLIKKSHLNCSYLLFFPLFHWSRRKFSFQMGDAEWFINKKRLLFISSEIVLCLFWGKGAIILPVLF